MSDRIIGKEPYNGGISNLCVCIHCKTRFLAGGNHHWHNHFFCGQRCAEEYNKCPDCGSNKWLCTCRETNNA